MIFDTHAHYDDEQFDPDREELLNSMEVNGVGTIVDVSSTYESCEQVLALAEQYPFIYAAIGVIPDEVGNLDEEKFAHLEELLDRDKVVAVGEIGLDYHWDVSPHDVQKKWLTRQLEMARSHDLPVMIHSRDAAADTMEILRQYAGELTGVLHCYSYSKEMAREYVKMGYFIGVGGVVTFKNSRKLKETVAEIPLTSIVLETDSPYLAPEPFRGKRNNSAYIKYVAEEVAGIKNISYDEVVGQTEKNAQKLFELGTGENSFSPVPNSD